MKQQELIGAILAGVFLAIIGLFVTNNFIANPDERKETVMQVRELGSGFSDEAKEYLQSNETTIYSVDVNVEESVGSGNQQPFNSGQ